MAWVTATVLPAKIRIARRGFPLRPSTNHLRRMNMLLSRIVHVFLAAMFSLAILAVTPSRAAEFKEYNASAVAAAQAAGRPILLDVSASWCPVCASQNATIKQTVGAAAYAKLIIFHIDFDSQEAVWKGYSVVRQAT